jgi:putative DNA methylase
VPHYDAAGEFQHIVFRLHDALPAAVVDRLSCTPLKDRLAKAESLLDRGVGSGALRNPRVASIVADTLLRFDRERYRLLAWCIMPNHVHVLIEEFDGWPLSSIVHSWKSFTASRANQTLSRTGRFWAVDYFDRAMRDDVQTLRTSDYIEANPVNAGICLGPADWRWSSARNASADDGQPKSGLGARAPE